MMISKKSILIFLAKLAEVYPIGNFTLAPGTLASFISTFIGFYLFKLLGLTNYIIFLFIFILIGYLLCEIHISVYKRKDPKEVVIDEFAGQFIAVLSTISSESIFITFLSLMLSFLLFRFFDITKIGPIKKLESLPGGIGIMADDVVAGLCAFIVQCGLLTAFDQQILIKM